MVSGLEEIARPKEDPDVLLGEELDLLETDDLGGDVDLAVRDLTAVGHSSIRAQNLGKI